MRNRFEQMIMTKAAPTARQHGRGSWGSSSEDAPSPAAHLLKWPKEPNTGRPDSQDRGGSVGRGWGGGGPAPPPWAGGNPDGAAAPERGRAVSVAGTRRLLWEPTASEKRPPASQGDPRLSTRSRPRGDTIQVSAGPRVEKQSCGCQRGTDRRDYCHIPRQRRVPRAL